ncbi:transposable element Tcb2 transposase [Trichonephila clavipes]|nr:transposable element Tcb2 transposase [Trichonephila clavipes]
MRLTASSAAIQAQVAPSLGAPVSSRTIRRRLAEGDESRFNLSSDDNRVRVWRPLGEHLNPAFALQRQTTPTAILMVLDAIAYNTRSPPVLIHVTMTAQRCVSNRAYLGSFVTASCASDEFERTRCKVTANVEGNASRNHTEVSCLNARTHQSHRAFVLKGV